MNVGSNECIVQIIFQLDCLLEIIHNSVLLTYEGTSVELFNHSTIYGIINTIFLILYVVFLFVHLSCEQFTNVSFNSIL